MASLFLRWIYLLSLACNIYLRALRRIIAVPSCIQTSSLRSLPIAILAYHYSSIISPICAPGGTIGTAFSLKKAHLIAQELFYLTSKSNHLT